MSASAIRTRLLDNLRIRLPGALDPVLKVEIFNTLDELCRGSYCWREDLEVEVVAADVTDERVAYDIDPSDGIIISLLRTVNSNDTPTYKATMQEPGVLVFDEVPAVDTYTATVALSVTDPVRTSDDFPVIEDWILEKHYHSILSGVLSKMMSQPAKPYANERLSIYHGREFRSGIAQARVAALRSNNYAAQTWRFPNFVQGSQR